MAFYQCCHVTVLGAAQQIAFPMTRNRSVFHFRRPFADGDGIDDLTAGGPAALFSILPALECTGYGKWFRGTLADSRHRDAGSFALPKTVRAANPAPV